MPKRARPHGPSRKMPSGLSEREEAFAQERRKDPSSQNWVIAQRAGFQGTPAILGDRARLLMKKPAVLAIINAPADPDPLDGEDGDLSDAKLLPYLKKQLLSIVRGRVSDKDKLSAIDKLIATIPGGYAPAGVDLRHTFGMEDIVRMMGGAPEDRPALRPLALPEPDKEQTA